MYCFEARLSPQQSPGAGGLGRIAKDTIQTRGQILDLKALLHSCF